MLTPVWYEVVIGRNVTYTLCSFPFTIVWENSLCHQLRRSRGSIVCLCMSPFVTPFDACYILWTVHARVLKLHGSKVSCESDLRSVPYNRPVGVRSFVKSVKWLRENQHYSWTVQDNLLKFHRLTQLVKMCVVGKNENFCSFRFLVICPLIELIMGSFYSCL